MPTLQKKNVCMHPLRACFIIPPACRRMDRQLIRAPELVGGGPLDSLTLCAAKLGRGAIGVGMRRGGASRACHRGLPH